MGNSSCTLVVRLEGQPAFASGDTITGRVYLNVTEPNGVQCNSLNIHFRGKEATYVHYTTEYENYDEQSNDGSRRHLHHRDYYEESDSVIIDLDVPLYRPMNGIFMPGQYEFPFQFTVPNNIPPSMKCNYGESRCSVEYEIKAYFHKQSSRSFTLNPLKQLNNTVSSQAIHVAIVGNNDAANAPVQDLYFPSESCHIKDCCKKMGYMELNAKMDSHRLQINVFNPKTYTVLFDLKNYSKVDVESVKMELVECIRWRSRTREESQRNTLAQASLHAGAFDSWKSFDENMLSLPTSSGTMESTLLMHGGSVASVGQNPATFTFVIPNQARESFSGNLIEVSHFVLVTTKTSKCCSTDPEISADVQLYRPPLRNGGESEIVSGSLTSAMADNGTNSNNGNPYAAYTDPGAGLSNPVVVDAVALPPGWTPQTADLVTLPIANIVETVSEGNEDAHETNQPTPSAPPMSEKYQ